MATDNLLRSEEAKGMIENRPPARTVSPRRQLIGSIIVSLFIAVGAISWLVSTHKQNPGGAGLSTPTSAQNIAFSVSGPCAKGVRFGPWKDDWGCWTSDMTFLGGLVSAIEYTAFDAGGVKIDSGTLIIKADVRPGETTVTKVCVPFNTERVVRVEILVSGYCN